eukprot:5764014-Prymnesium_polylepis.1
MPSTPRTPARSRSSARAPPDRSPPRPPTPGAVSVADAPVMARTPTRCVRRGRPALEARVQAVWGSLGGCGDGGCGAPASLSQTKRRCGVRLGHRSRGWVWCAPVVGGRNRQDRRATHRRPCLPRTNERDEIQEPRPGCAPSADRFLVWSASLCACGVTRRP